MARPPKRGLDYFPLDVNMFEDEKVMAISKEFGIKGEIVLIRLLCAIYRNGYYAMWNDRLKNKLLMDMPGISSELLDTIVTRLARWGVIDQTLFRSMSVLTSSGIQSRYFSIARRRNYEENRLPYLLVGDTPFEVTLIDDERGQASNDDFSCKFDDNQAKINDGNNPINVCNNPVIDGNNPLKKRKENIKKTPKGVKENAVRFHAPTVEEVRQYIDQKGYRVNAELFVAYNSSRGWTVGSGKMKNWHQAVATWHYRDQNQTNHANPRTNPTADLRRGSIHPNATRPQDYEGDF